MKYISLICTPIDLKFEQWGGEHITCIDGFKPKNPQGPMFLGAPQFVNFILKKIKVK